MGERRALGVWAIKTTQKQKDKTTRGYKHSPQKENENTVIFMEEEWPSVQLITLVDLLAKWVWRTYRNYTVYVLRSLDNPSDSKVPVIGCSVKAASWISCRGSYKVMTWLHVHKSNLCPLSNRTWVARDWTCDSGYSGCRCVSQQALHQNYWKRLTEEQSLAW